MTKLSRIKGAAKDLVVSDVKKLKNAEFITERCPEVRTHQIKFYHEAKLSCGHYEYRYVGRMHEKPTRLGCAACTKRHLTVKERAISA